MKPPHEAARLFPSLGADEIEARVSRRWRIASGRFPLPTFTPRCPFAHRGWHELEAPVQLSRIGYGISPGSRTRYRADVHMKCTDCSAHWTHGVVISEGVYRRAMATGTGSVWHWREIRDALEGEGSP